MFTRNISATWKAMDVSDAITIPSNQMMAGLFRKTVTCAIQLSGKATLRKWNTQTLSSLLNSSIPSILAMHGMSGIVLNVIHTCISPGVWVSGCHQDSRTPRPQDSRQSFQNFGGIPVGNIALIFCKACYQYHSSTFP